MAGSSPRQGELSRVFCLGREACPSGCTHRADNVIRDGAVINARSKDETVRGVRTFNRLVAGERRVSATEIQTVGAKGYDGFALVLVRT